MLSLFLPCACTFCRLCVRSFVVDGLAWSETLWECSSRLFGRSGAPSADRRSCLHCYRSSTPVRSMERPPSWNLSPGSASRHNHLSNALFFFISIELATPFQVGPCAAEHGIVPSFIGLVCKSIEHSRLHGYWRVSSSTRVGLRIFIWILERYLYQPISRTHYAIQEVKITTLNGQSSSCIYLIATCFGQTSPIIRQVCIMAA